MRKMNPALNSTDRETAYGRRITSKTFTILGASTPEIRSSTTGASRKTKIMDHRPKYKMGRAYVFKMHNGSLLENRLIALPCCPYVTANANRQSAIDPDNESTT